MYGGFAYVHICELHIPACLCTTYALCMRKSERELDELELELQTGLSCLVCAVIESVL